jgi:hypothetical protein
MSKTLSEVAKRICLGCAMMCFVGGPYNLHWGLLEFPLRLCRSLELCGAVQK